MKNYTAPIGSPISISLFHSVYYRQISVGTSPLFFEIVGAFALVFGIATRFFSISLIILTIVAIAAVHWPEQWNTLSELLKGYRISDSEQDSFGNYKLPLLYIIIFAPLLLNGAGKLSVDHLVKRFIR